METLGDAASSDPAWRSAWLEIQDARMAAFYWLSDLQAYAELIERVRPFVDAQGTAQQRAGFFETLLTYALRRDRYVVSEEIEGYARANLAAAEQTQDPTVTAWARFNLGFTLLWTDRTDQAGELLRASLRDGDLIGDITLTARANTYLMVLSRRCGDPRAVEAAIEPVLRSARAASLPEYEAMALANRSWVHARAGRSTQAEADARAALDLWRSLAVRYPFEWMALWPLVALELDRGRIAEAIGCGRGMLAEHQQPLPEDLRGRVDRALEAWEAGSADLAEEELRLALPPARRLAFL